jgi:hypothetical protein
MDRRSPTDRDFVHELEFRPEVDNQALGPEEGC